MDKYTDSQVFVYDLIDPRDNSIFYVGSTINPDKRKGNYIGVGSIKRIYNSRLRNRLLDIISDNQKPIFSVYAIADYARGRTIEYERMLQLKKTGADLLNLLVVDRKKQIRYKSKKLKIA